MIPICDTPYGSFRTRTFADNFPDFFTFASITADGTTSSTADYHLWSIFSLREISSSDKRLIYYLLYSRFGNSHIANGIDENQFRFRLFSKLFQYAPTWLKELEIQKKLRELTDAELILGSEATYNHAFNPENSPATSSRDAINYINDQNKTLYTKSKMEGYSNLLALLKTDVTEEFLNHFNDLFIKITEGDYPLLYVTTEENQ